MPYSIFYSGHFAIHGTNQVKRLGRPASAGCIRLHPANAAKLFNLVKSEGLRNMRVVVE
jgi:lipoprotein-anchoring transpeptidase ErfK/SrfK